MGHLGLCCKGRDLLCLLFSFLEIENLFAFELLRQDRAMVILKQKAGVLAVLLCDVGALLLDSIDAHCLLVE
jgi:hypothetical protein